MKTTFTLLIAAAVFAMLAMSFGYQNLYYNYLYWVCWDQCIVFESKKCNEICKEQELQPEPTPESLAQSIIESKQKSNQLRELYHPILHEYADSIHETKWVFSHGSSWNHPESIEDNLEAEFEYSDGIFHYKQKLDIVSPMSQAEDAGRILVTKELVFPELGVFLVFIVGVFSFVGFRIRRNEK